MNRMLPALAILFGAPVVAWACLWDRDTPRSEAVGMPEVVAAITGRFERNPPLFYEMRLARVSDHLKGYPEDLSAYDDAGVACDRLGRGDEAIDWMKKKQERLAFRPPADAETKEHAYRYHANLGTFLVHRWAKQGADRAKIAEVKAARDEIAKALEINPDAHFGREKYQLKALDWIIDPPSAKEGQFLPNLLNMAVELSREQDPKEADDAVRGLAGLIMLGNAWESVDVFYALSIALQNDALGVEPGTNAGRNGLANLALMRAKELVDAGKRSMLPDAWVGDDLKSSFWRPDFINDQEYHKEDFLRLRLDAEQWQKARTDFMLARLEQGLHPDTDANFWSGYVERPAMPLPDYSVPDAYTAAYTRKMNRIRLVFAGILVLIGMGISVFFWWWLKAVYHGTYSRTV
ncbi:hypothetical protein GC170_12180 [bacterium]|nr:hypothetical protein [bacterium]